MPERDADLCVVSEFSEIPQTCDVVRITKCVVGTKNGLRDIGAAYRIYLVCLIKRDEIRVACALGSRNRQNFGIGECAGIEIGWRVLSEEPIVFQEFADLCFSRIAFEFKFIRRDRPVEQLCLACNRYLYHRSCFVQGSDDDTRRDSVRTIKNTHNPTQLQCGSIIAAAWYLKGNAFGLIQVPAHRDTRGMRQRTGKCAVSAALGLIVF